MSVEVLLEILSDGEFHSGTELGNRLGISRAAVWKQLKKVEYLGLPLTSVKARGYRLEGGVELLSQPAITKSLTRQSSNLIKTLEVMGIVDSTNTLAMAAAAAGQTGYVITAEQQTAGRGRRGRNWVSPYGSNIYLSVVWRFDNGVSSLDGLSLATGVTIVAALEELGIQQLNLKWPNDVLHNGRKLAGVLIELTGDASGPCHIALGIGLNVRMPNSTQHHIEQPWVDLDTITNTPNSRNTLTATLLNHLMPMLQNFTDGGFTNYRSRWQALDAYAQQPVCLQTPGGVVEGQAVGVNETGAIMIRTPKGTQAFHGGELTLRTGT